MNVLLKWQVIVEAPSADGAHPAIFFQQGNAPGTVCERFHVEKLLRRILGDEFFAKGRFLAGDALPVGYPGDAASGFIAIQRADDGGERCGFLGVTAAHRLVGDNTLDAFFR